MNFITKIFANINSKKAMLPAERTFGFTLLSCCVLVGFLCFAPQTASAQTDDSRVALVIGNDNYAKDPLKNAVNDARRMAEVLSALNFRVVVRLNATLDDMNSGLVEFHRLLPEARAAVFFYAGHGLQNRGKNFLVPVGANITSEIEIRTKSFEAGSVLEYMDDAKVSNKIMILDACRNNPFGSEFQVSESGLASMRTSSGTVVAFAAKPGAFAFEAGSNEENGLYTKHLLKEIVKPNLQSSLMFENVSRAVQQESGGKQVPEVLSSPSAGRRAFFFVEGAAPQLAQIAPGNTGAARSQSGPSGPSVFDQQAAQEMWSLVKNSNRVEDYQQFLKDFPASPLASAAKFQLDTLLRAQVSAQPLNAAQTAAPAVLVAEPAKASAPATAPPAMIAVAPSRPIIVPPATVPAPALATAPATTLAPVPAINLSGVQPAVVAAPALATMAAPVPSKVTVAPAVAPSIAAPVVAAPAVVTAPIALPSTVNLPGASVAPVVPSVVPAAVPAVVVNPNAIQNGRVEFTNNEYYVGEFKELADKSRVLHGAGEFVAQTSRYKGSFLENKKHGRGEYTWQNGEKYNGDWVHDSQSGKGKWTWPNGNWYEGQFKNGIIVGEGEFFFADRGDSFKGSFLAGKAHGKGVYTYSTGDRYEGEMQAGVPSGRGVYRYKGGDVIEGTFENGAANGRGKYSFASGNRYEGDMVAGALTGNGAFSYTNGSRYEGDFVNGNPKGKGEFQFSDGSTFIGIFEDGTRKASGVLIEKNGTKTDADMIDTQVHKRK